MILSESDFYTAMLLSSESAQCAPTASYTHGVITTIMSMLMAHTLLYNRKCHTTIDSN